MKQVSPLKGLEELNTIIQFKEEETFVGFDGLKNRPLLRVGDKNNTKKA